MKLNTGTPCLFSDYPFFYVFFHDYVFRARTDDQRDRVPDVEIPWTCAVEMRMPAYASGDKNVNPIRLNLVQAQQVAAGGKRRYLAAANFIPEQRQLRRDFRIVAERVFNAYKQQFIHPFQRLASAHFN